MTKYIFFTGGVVSSLGKGLTAASLGALLKGRGLKVGVLRLDTYFNTDTGMMNPYQHGEVFVTNDGAETDLALGHYERFMNVSLTGQACSTLGRIYRDILDRERAGDFGGNTVQVIPHITNEIKRTITEGLAAHNFDVIIVEIGGTVGDIESLAFVETIRQMRRDLGRRNTLFVHVALVPYLRLAGETKTKPVQHSVKTLRSLGIQPDVIVCRSEESLDEGAVNKISLFCDIDREAVFQQVYTDNVYELPLNLHRQGFDDIVADRLGLPQAEADIHGWEEFYRRSMANNKTVRLALVGKYTSLPDAYISLAEALRHCSINLGLNAEIEMLAAQELDAATLEDKLAGFAGIVIPDGFGARGAEGMILAAGYARRHNVPLLGIGMGMHAALVEYARNVARIPAAMPETGSADVLFEGRGCGSLVRGQAAIRLAAGSRAAAVYGSEDIAERHRYRYVLREDIAAVLEQAGMVFSGRSLDGGSPEIVELPGQDWYIGCQYHPEFTSRPEHPHPLISDFLTVCAGR